MVQKHLLNLYHARTAGMLSGASRVAMMLLVTLLLTMTAQTAWAETYTYTVSFQKCEGTGGSNSVQATLHEPMPQISVPTREGYTFGGYFSDYEGRGTQYYNADGNSTHVWDIEHDKELYAMWTTDRINMDVYFTFGDSNYADGEALASYENDGLSVTINGQSVSRSVSSYPAISLAGQKNTISVSLPSYLLASSATYDYYNTEYNNSVYNKVENTPMTYEGGKYTWSFTIADDAISPQWRDVSIKIDLMDARSRYTVFFDPNGGTGTMMYLIMEEGNSRILPTCTFTRDDYTFLGWATSADGGKVYDDGEEITFDSPGTQTLYAMWSNNAAPATYTVTFDANGGEGDAMAAQTFTIGVAQNLSDCTFTREGYTFDGWATETDGSKVYDNGAEITFDSPGTQTLYAKWTPQEYDINYVLYDGTNNESNPDTYTCESENITLAAPTAPENSGYTFGGWYTDAIFTTAVSTPAIPQGSTGEMTFYAKWLKSVTVTVNWSDNSNQDGIRPESVVVILLANNEEAEEFTVTKPEGNPNSWTGTAVSKPVHKAGAPIVYTWAMANEKIPTGYTLGIDVENATLNLTHEPEKTEAKVNVAWDDVNNQDGKRPESVTVTLSNGAAVTLNESNNWNATVGNLPKYASGQPITYTWTEGTLPDGYSKTHTSTSTDELGVTTTTLQLSYTPEETEVKVTKVWDDSDNQDGKRPDDVTVNLLADGKIIDTVTLSEENEWNYSWTRLDKKANGEDIDYTVTEVAVAEYTTNITKATDGTFTYTVTNSHETEETEATVELHWNDNNNQDGIRPESVTVTLSNGTEVTLNVNNNWTATVEDLPKYASGQEIAYTWTPDETNLSEGYLLTDSSKDGTTTTLTYSHTPGETSVTANVVWSDGNNTEGFRPESVTVKLMNGEEIGSVSLNVSNNWSYTWTGLPTHEGGEAITYTVTEDAVDNYSTTIEGFTITNSRTVEMTTATLNIIWLDDTNKYGVRPASLNATLSDGTNETSYTINENLLNGTYFSFIVNNLQKYINGTEIVYSLTITDEIDCYKQTGLDKNGNTTTYTMHLMTMGNCGQTGSEAALTWEYNTAEKTLYIIGSGQMMYYNSVQNGESWSNGAPWKAFANEIEHVVISDGITYVGSNTFAHCPSISSVTLPTSGIYWIGDGAFADCTSLESIDIPMSINTIGNQAFAGCSSLATVSIGYGDPGTFTLGSEVFPVTTTILVPESAYEKYINEKAVKESVEIDNPFYGYKDKIVPATRTFFANGTNTWMTWCDVNAWTLPEGCTAYTVSSVSGTTVTLSNALTTIPAYTPVLIQRDANVTAPVTATFSAVGTVPDSGYDSATGIASTTDTGWAFYGTTTDLATIPEANYSAGLTYVLYGDKFLKSDNNSGIAANRCWLKLEAGGGTSGARLLSIVIDDNPTAIDNVQWSMVNGQSDSWYTIDGRKLNGKPTKKGLYIYNGKKVAIK